MKFQTDGLIIKEQNFGENDKLIWVLTRTHGVIHAVAKGAKSLKSAKGAPTSLLSYSRLTFYQTKDRYTVGDALSLRIFSKLRSDVRKMCLAQYFCELALQICPREQPADKFLSLTLNALYLLSEGKRSEQLVKPCYEMRLSCMAGYMPDLLMCSDCGAYTAEAMLFHPQSGAISCASHGHQREGDILLGEAALTALRHTVYADFEKLFSFELKEELLAPLSSASERYVAYMTQKDYPTLQFYKSMLS